MFHPAVLALKSIHRSFIGGFRTRGPQASKYMPHLGKKEHARHAGRPDGVMHSVGPIHERNAQAALFDMPKTRKPRAARVTS